MIQLQLFEPKTTKNSLLVVDIGKREAANIVVEKHYLHRKPPISFAFGLIDNTNIVGVLTFGVPPSRHLQKSVCPSSPDNVVELNRLWVCDSMPKNTESWFISRALKAMPPFLICSYADSSFNHVGYVYRASNWFYAGYTDMERKTPRYDYCVPGKHSRDAFRGKTGYVKVRRKPKYKYWTVTGDKRQRKRLEAICGWPKLSWKEVSPKYR